MKKLLPLLLFLAFVVPCHAEEIIKGWVRDSKTYQPIAGADISTTLNDKTTRSNEEGQFLLDIGSFSPPGIDTTTDCPPLYTITFKTPKYKTYKLTMQLIDQEWQLVVPLDEGKGETKITDILHWDRNLYSHGKCKK